MLPVLQKMKEKNATYSRILTNRMTIVGYRLFKHSHKIHLAFIVYRLKRDFGFTWWEVANFTGIPEKKLIEFYLEIKPLLDTEILKYLANLDEEGALEEWRNIPDTRNGKQGKYIVRETKAWFDDMPRTKSRQKEPEFRFGGESEKDYNKTTEEQKHG